jgi:hypothetical protein
VNDIKVLIYSIGSAYGILKGGGWNWFKCCVELCMWWGKMIYKKKKKLRKTKKEHMVS